MSRQRERSPCGLAVATSLLLCLHAVIGDQELHSAASVVRTLSGLLEQQQLLLEQHTSHGSDQVPVELAQQGVADILDTVYELLDTGCDMESFSGMMDALQDSVGQLQSSAHTSYPMTRRLVQSALELASQKGGAQCTNQLHEGYHMMMEHFRGLFHAAHEARGKKTYFLHISRSGGTSLCRVARSQPQLTIAEAEPPCNCALDRLFHEPLSWANAYASAISPGRQWWAQPGPPRELPWTCEKRAEWMANPDVRGRIADSKGIIDFTMSEYLLPSAVHEPPPSAPEPGQASAYQAAVCPQFTTFTMLRRPLSHALSLLTYMRQAEPAYPANVSELEIVTPMVMDSYNIRSLSTPEVFHSPVGTINASHLVAAAAKLLQFDAVLTTEDGASSDVFLQQGLGWAAKISTVHEHTLTFHQQWISGMRDWARQHREQEQQEQGQQQAPPRRHALQEAGPEDDIAWPSVEEVPCTGYLAVRLASDSGAGAPALEESDLDSDVEFQEALQLVDPADQHQVGSQLRQFGGSPAQAAALLRRLIQLNKHDAALHAFASKLQDMDARFFSSQGL